jgi:hypothetical protein
MRVVFALMGLVVAGGIAIAVIDQQGSSQDGVFHPDHSEVFNEFQRATSELVGNDGVSSVPPDSECKQIEETTWRCYRRWAPVDQPEAVEILQADVEVYEDRVVVGEVSRSLDP